MAIFLKGDGTGGTGISQLGKDILYYGGSALVGTAAISAAAKPTLKVGGAVLKGAGKLIYGAATGPAKMYSAVETGVTTLAKNPSLLTNPTQGLGQSLNKGMSSAFNVGDYGTPFPKGQPKGSVDLNIPKPKKPLTLPSQVPAENVPKLNVKVVTKNTRAGKKTVLNYDKDASRYAIQQNRHGQKKILDTATKTADQIKSSPASQARKDKLLSNLRKKTSKLLTTANVKSLSKIGLRQGAKKAALAAGAAGAAVVGAPVVAGAIAVGGTALTLYDVGKGVVNVVNKKKSGSGTRFKF